MNRFENYSAVAEFEGTSIGLGLWDTGRCLIDFVFVVIMKVYLIDLCFSFNQLAKRIMIGYALCPIHRPMCFFFVIPLLHRLRLTTFVYFNLEPWHDSDVYICICIRFSANGIPKFDVIVQTHLFCWWAPNKILETMKILKNISNLKDLVFCALNKDKIWQPKSKRLTMLNARL